MSLIPKEVDGLEVPITLLQHVLQAISLIPPGGENVKADLPTNAIRETIVREFLLQSLDEIPANVGLAIVCFEIISFLVPRSRRRG